MWGHKHLKAKEEPAIKLRGGFKKENLRKKRTNVAIGGEETVCVVRTGEGTVGVRRTLRYQEERSQEHRPSKGSKEGREDGEKILGRVT